MFKAKQKEYEKSQRRLANHILSIVASSREASRKRYVLRDYILSGNCGSELLVWLSKSLPRDLVGVLLHHPHLSPLALANIVQILPHSELSNLANYRAMSLGLLDQFYLLPSSPHLSRSLAVLHYSVVGSIA